MQRQIFHDSLKKVTFSPVYIIIQLFFQLKLSDQKSAEKTKCAVVMTFCMKKIFRGYKLHRIDSLNNTSFKITKCIQEKYF